MMLRTNGNKSCLIPEELLDDIASRFLLDAPDRELKDPISLCFLTELAYWFYLDEYVEEDDTLNTIKFDSFALHLLQHVKIQPMKGTLEEMLQEFRDFKHRVPTYGALILNTDLSHVLLVQGFWHRASWGFPKGKINVDEEPYKCAIREVLEETGYDISSRIHKDLFLEALIGGQKVRLYIIPGVSMTTEFTPRTKGEIKELKWFLVNQLPSHKNDRNFSKTTGPSNMFYMVMPFVKPLREWLALRPRSGSVPTTDQQQQQQKGGTNGGGRESRRRHRSLTTSSVCNAQPSHSSSVSAGGPAAEVSPRKRESKSKSKSKKSHSANAGGDNTCEDHNQQKFTFKNRGKSKGSHFNNANNNNSNNNNNNNNNSTSNSKSNSNTHQPLSGFRCHSWQNFKINKRAINEALDAAWSGVTIQMEVK